MHEFIDKRGRTILIETDGDNAEAFHNGNKISFLTTTGLQEVDERATPFPAQITGWETNVEYRRAGIATRLVECLVEEIGPLYPADKDIGVGGMNALTSEGMVLTRYCQKKGLILEFKEDREPEYDDE